MGRRTALLGGLAAVAGAVSGCVNAPVEPRSETERLTTPTRRPTSTPKPPPTLPTGGRTVFPGNRLVGYCGAPGAAALGRMTGNLSTAAGQLVRQARSYHTDRPVLPVVELIATVVNGAPGPDGKYRTRASDSTIEQYLAHARAVHGLLLLNIQPGLADFLPEVAAYRRWLAEPDIGVALDPEWAVEPGVVPGQKFGHTTGAELDSVSAYLSGLVRRYDLPEKVMVYHQVAASVVSREHDLLAHEGVAAVKSVDGIGVPGSKLATWRKLMRTKPAHVRAGFKLFYSEDTESGPLMTPAQVLRLSPTPSYVMYE
ncbi:MAG: hypothetical protein ACRDQ5_00270 [Sciscionella sp.]